MKTILIILVYVLELNNRNNTFSNCKRNYDRFDVKVNDNCFLNVYIDLSNVLPYVWLSWSFVLKMDMSKAVTIC